MARLLDGGCDKRAAWRAALPDRDPFDAEYKRRPSLGLSETRADEDEHQWLEWLLLLLGGLGLIVGIAFGAFVLIRIWRSIR